MGFLKHTAVSAKLGAFFMGLGLLALSAGADQAMAQNHSYINYMRSGSVSHVFVQQSVDGEYGKHTANGSLTADDGSSKSFNETQTWKGYGIGTTLGLELMKFIQFVGGHTFVNLRHKNDALESLNGSRLHGGLRAVFSAPIANLELGMGLQGSRLDYQKQLQNASFYGSGSYYSLGMNYFMTSQISVYYEAKMAKEHLVQSGGSSVVDSMDTDMTSMGLGFRIWL